MLPLTFAYTQGLAGRVTSSFCLELYDKGID